MILHYLSATSTVTLDRFRLNHREAHFVLLRCELLLTNTEKLTFNHYNTKLILCNNITRETFNLN